MHKISFFVFFNYLALSSPARILAYMIAPSYSDQVVYQPLWRELSLRGHQVTLITTDPLNDPNLTNLTEIDLSFSYNISREKITTIINSGENSFTVLKRLLDVFFDIINKQMEHPEVNNLIINQNQTFDVFLVQQLLAPPVAFAERFNCPLIGITTSPLPEIIYRYFGIPTHQVLYPDGSLPFSVTETFLERFTSVIFEIFTYLFLYAYVKPIQSVGVQKYFGTGYSDLDKIESNASLIFVNANPILDRPRPVTPGIVYVGGIHRVPEKPLPESLKTELDSASKGFIYFSLGTNVQSKNVLPNIRETLLQTFSELPYKILWKHELDNLPNKSDNVIISKWFPQSDILRHPNIKLFITQGGIVSMEEAIYAKVPMVGIPFFGDQFTNIQKMVQKGFGLSLDVTNLNKEELKKAILEVITNPKFKIKVKQISELAQDQPMSGLQQAVWWTEYVIRNKGAHHLQSPLKNIPWYQYLLLDVFITISVTVIISLYTVIVVIKCLKHKLKSQ